MNPGSPLSLTTSPRLDGALARGADDWLAAVRALGPAGTVRWMAQRADLAEQLEDVRDVMKALLAAEDEDEAAGLMSELAELVTGDDDDLAATLAEGVLAHGLAVGDAEVIADAVGHLAELAEESGDPLTAAEYHIDFLNWRRRPDASSDPEAVATAFDEVIRLAELDGAAQAAAVYGFRQVAFQRVADAEGDAATTGDWDPAAGPYAPWA